MSITFYWQNVSRNITDYDGRLITVTEQNLLFRNLNDFTILLRWLQSNRFCWQFAVSLD